MTRPGANDDQIFQLLDLLAKVALERDNDAAILPSKDAGAPPHGLSVKVSEAVRDVALARELELLESAATTAAEIPDDAVIWPYQEPPTDLKARIGQAVATAVPVPAVFSSRPQPPQIYLSMPLTQAAENEASTMRELARIVTAILESHGASVVLPNAHWSESGDVTSTPESEYVAAADKLLRSDALVVIYVKHPVDEGVALRYAERGAVPTIVLGSEAHASPFSSSAGRYDQVEGPSDAAVAVNAWLVENADAIVRRSASHAEWDRQTRMLLPILADAVSRADDKLLLQHFLTRVEATLAVSSGSAYMATTTRELARLLHLCESVASTPRGSLAPLQPADLGNLAHAVINNDWSPREVADVVAAAAESSTHARLPVSTSDWMRIHATVVHKVAARVERPRADPTASATSAWVGHSTPPRPVLMGEDVEDEW